MYIVYLDDILVLQLTGQRAFMLSKLKCYETSMQAGLCLMCLFMILHVEYRDKEGLLATVANISTIKKALSSKNKSQLKGFLGLVN